MARKHEAAGLLKAGHSPATIAHKMGISVASAMGYLYNQVGEGRIRRSDIVFAIAPDVRKAVESAISRIETASEGTVGTTGHQYQIYEAVRNSVSKRALEDALVYVQLRDARVVLGDMYEMIRDIEVTLHLAIKKGLQDEYGDSGDNWWRKGIPQKINEECASAWARDEEPADEPYRYTTFIHLKEIFAKEWAILKRLVPEDTASNKNDFLSRLGKANQIRNSVMHPVKSKTLTEDDFAFVREFQGQLDLERLRFFIRTGRFPVDPEVS